MRSSKIGIDRLVALIDYVEATERDRLRTVLDMVDYRGFRRFGDDLIKLPGVLVNVREADDHCWLTVERLVRCPPPVPDDAELRVWIELPDEVNTAPALRSEVPRALVGDGDADPATPGTVALNGFAGRARLESALEGYRRERWSRWAEEERPRRQSIELYNGLFALRQSLEGGTEQPVELVWGIGIAQWTRDGAKLHHPLISVPVEISLSEHSHAIEVRPRSEAPVAIESGPMDALGVSSAEDWRNGAQRYFDGLEGDGVTPFATESFAPVLRRAVAVLDPDGAYLPDLGERRPPVGDTLRVDDRWVLLERTRQGTQLMDDLRSLRGQVSALDDVSALPAAVRALIESPTDAAVAEAYPALRGVSTIPGVTSSDGSGSDLFFPKPFNREQVEVIQRLSTRAGVVVQGPPGTGKTHTIANIISHYLALGKRVLVTSQKAPPLKVLREKLPEAVRPLAVSLLESDRDGLKQFQESVDIIADRVQRTRPADAARQIAALDARVEALHRGLAVIDRQIDDIGRGAMASAVVDGAPIEPADAARRLVRAGAAADWITDPIDVIASHEPVFDDEAIASLRAARKSVGERIVDLDHAVPDAALPDVDALILMHRSLLSADEIERTTTGAAAVSPGTSLDAISALRVELETLRAVRSDVSADVRGWTVPVMARWRSDPDDPPLLGLEGLRGEVGELCDLARHFLVRPVTLSEGAADDRDFREAVGTLAAGGDLGLFHSLFARQLKQQVGSVRLSGRAPTDPSQWTEIARYLSALDMTVSLGAAWNNAAPHAGLDLVPVEGPSAGELMRRQLDHVGRLREVVRRERSAEAEIHAILPASGRHNIATDAGIDALVELLDRHLRLARLSDARADRTRLVQSVSGVEGALGEDVREILGTMVGHHATDVTLLARRWEAVLTEVDALTRLAPAFSRIRSVCTLIEESGAPAWAELLRRQPVVGIEDPMTPGDWRERWTLRRLATWLARIDRHDRLRALGADRTDHEDRLRRAYEDAIEQRTWCRLAEKASDQVRAALAAYAQAMRRLGRGTGVRAGRYRADARAAADRAKNALPCWIMPHYRVSESLPAELGLFDLVIIDEASQSTMAALPALLRAKQVLIVGDDRQVSPDAGFREEARMNLLADRHLGGQVSDYRSALREEKSLYDLGTVVFAGGAIMLKEHFRCVAPIIEYSKAQFYSHQLEPLRLPSASERLDPPLVDIMVEDGYRKGKVNPPEVDCIVDAISRISDDPAMKGRSIGVTTLLGQEQAVAIQTAIEQVLGTEVMLRHDIRVGEPVAFQGDERDIMFVSLVADRGSSGLSGLGYEQRFNVAASRARDRMVLVRSVELEDLRPSDRLRRSLIEHFHAPFAGDGALNADRRTRCESPFETDMYDLLVERGFRVDTQVAVGSKRIDLVVEGSDDRRLAIECDGDRYHGPEQWPDDMARQRMLERAGWTVWRCFASRFLRDRRGVMDELVAVLAARGIFPESGDALPPSRHTEHRRWRSIPLDAEHVPYAWLVLEEAV